LRVDAALELDIAASTAHDLEVAFSRIRLELDGGSNLQARARQARHAALQREAARVGAKVIALGHTADDRAETFMMRLLRGAGPRGLGVIPPFAPAPVAPGTVPLVRPLLRARRTDVMLHLERHALSFASDPTNRDRRFLRARVRHELIPLLEELSPGVVDHLCQIADMLRAESVPDPLAGLGRAQRLAIRRAILLGRPSATVRVSGGQELSVDFSEKTPVLLDEQ
jgi:tRNA(Ile)-lysidine synthase